MINKVAHASISFKGTIVKNDTLKSVLEYAKEIATDNNRPFTYTAENITSSLNYMLNETPKTDVFELKHVQEGDDSFIDVEEVQLLKNNKKILSIPTDNVYSRTTRVIKAGVYVLKDFALNKQLNPKPRQTTKEIHQLDEIRSKMYADYDKKQKELEKEYQKQKSNLFIEHEKEIAKLDKKQNNLYLKRENEIINDLDKVTKKLGYEI